MSVPNSRERRRIRVDAIVEIFLAGNVGKTTRTGIRVGTLSVRRKVTSTIGLSIPHRNRFQRYREESFER
jgi:hypothetical protein